MTSVGAILLLLFLMLLAGTLSGIASYSLKFKEESENSPVSRMPFILNSNVASLLVPLFLFLIDNSLVDDVFSGASLLSTEIARSLFVFFGFCLLAGMYADRFIEGVALGALRQKLNSTEKILQSTQDEVRSAKNAIDIIDDTFVESDSEPDLVEFAESKIGVSDQDRSILKAFKESKKPFRSFQGIARELNIELPQTQLALEGLALRGFVKKVFINDSIRWRITRNGLQFVEYELSK